MSSNRAVLAVMAACTVALSACATQNPIRAANVDTPLDQFQPRVSAAPQGILLRAGAPELSTAQYNAVFALVRDWREAGSGAIIVETPGVGGPAVPRTVARIEAALQTFGVRPEQFATQTYDAGGEPQAPIKVSFLRYEVQTPNCGQMISSDLTATFTNKVHSNFGCATIANMAAMVANPTDLAIMRAEAPFDAARRQSVLDKYRAGEPTGSAKDTQADGAVSRAVD